MSGEWPSEAAAGVEGHHPPAQAKRGRWGNAPAALALALTAMGAQPPETKEAGEGPHREEINVSRRLAMLRVRDRHPSGRRRPTHR